MSLNIYICALCLEISHTFLPVLISVPTTLTFLPGVSLRFLLRPLQLTAPVTSQMHCSWEASGVGERILAATNIVSVSFILSCTLN